MRRQDRRPGQREVRVSSCRTISLASRLPKATRIVQLEVKLTDTADHTETITKTYPVAISRCKVSLMPEGGRIVPGMENRIFAAAMYPDGSPAVCDVKLWLGAEGRGRPVRHAQDGRRRSGRVSCHPQGRAVPPDEWAQRQCRNSRRQIVAQIWLPKPVCSTCRVEAKDDQGQPGDDVPWPWAASRWARTSCCGWTRPSTRAASR